MLTGRGKKLQLPRVSRIHFSFYIFVNLRYIFSSPPLDREPRNKYYGYHEQQRFVGSDADAKRENANGEFSYFFSIFRFKVLFIHKDVSYIELKVKLVSSKLFRPLVAREGATEHILIPYTIFVDDLL